MHRHFDIAFTPGTNFSCCTTLQTYYDWQPGFSGCRRQGLEHTVGQSRLHIVITVLSAPSENIFVPAIFFIALHFAVVYITYATIK